MAQILRLSQALSHMLPCCASSAAMAMSCVPMVFSRAAMAVSCAAAHYAVCGTACVGCWWCAAMC